MKGTRRSVYFEAACSTNDLSRRALKGGAISMVASAINIAVQVISTIVLARLMLPEDFGLVAMAIAVTGFASIFVDLGTRDAIAQRGTITEGETSALVWMTFAIGLVCTLTLITAAPFVARFYHSPQLEQVTQALSLTFLLPALYCQQYALMRRALMFNTLAVIDIISYVLSVVVAITLAYEGHGYWALVARQVLVQLFSMIGVWLTCGWWPGRPSFDSRVKDLVRFGLNITGFTMTDYVAKSADRIGLGYTYGPRDLGFYQNASLVYDNPISLFASLHNIATVTLSKLRDDLARLRRAWATALSSLTFFAAPAFAILAVVAQDLVVVLLGSRWLEAGMILTILALRGPAHVVERTLGWLHVAAGRADRWRRWGFLNCAVMLAALLCGLPFGVIGVAAAYALSTYLIAVPAIAYAGKPLGITARDLVKAVGPAVVASLGIAALGLILKMTLFADTMPLVRLVILTALCGIAYLVIMVLGFRVTRPLEIAASMLRRGGLQGA